jgi:hypothetical protein
VLSEEPPAAPLEEGDAERWNRWNQAWEEWASVRAYGAPDVSLPDITGNTSNEQKRSTWSQFGFRVRGAIEKKEEYRELKALSLHRLEALQRDLPRLAIRFGELQKVPTIERYAAVLDAEIGESELAAWQRETSATVHSWLAWTALSRCSSGMIHRLHCWSGGSWPMDTSWTVSVRSLLAPPRSWKRSWGLADRVPGGPTRARRAGRASPGAAHRPQATAPHRHHADAAGRDAEKFRRRRSGCLHGMPLEPLLRARYVARRRRQTESWLQPATTTHP